MNYLRTSILWVLLAVYAIDSIYGGKLAALGESLSKSICGYVNKSLHIEQGEPSLLGDFPWMAALGYKRQGYFRVEWLCGGSLINTKYVLTAAHCVVGTQPWELHKVRLGDLDLNDTVKDKATPIDFSIERIIVRENYISATLGNDIALVKLHSSVEFTNLIKPICLPTTNDLRTINLEDHMVRVAGWGKPFREFRSNRTHLMDVELPILNTSVCKKAYKGFSETNVDERNICAGFIKGGKDSCQGDSGGPLMWRNPSDSRYYAVGIVSFGFICGKPGYPGVYTKVSEYADWIESNAI